MEVTNLDFRYRIMTFEAADEVTVEGEREHKHEELFGLNCHEGLNGAEGLHHRMSHFIISEVSRRCNAGWCRRFYIRRCPSLQRSREYSTSNR